MVILAQDKKWGLTSNKFLYKGSKTNHVSPNVPFCFLDAFVLIEKETFWQLFCQTIFNSSGLEWLLSYEVTCGPVMTTKDSNICFKDLLISFNESAVRS